MITKLFHLIFRFRTYFLLSFLTCTLSLLISFFYLEYYQGFIPCVLCWVQRGLFALIGFIALIATIHNPSGIGRRIYTGLTLIVSLLGLLAAGRQIWLKFNPGYSGCLPTTIEDIFTDNALFQAIFKSFQGTPDCGLFQGAFFGIEIAYWGLILFTGFTITLLYQLIRKGL